MTDIITDFTAIAKIARLKALDGRPQDDVTAGIAPQVAVEPEQGWHVYWQENLYGPAVEKAQDYPAMYWAGPGQRWVQDASGKWVTEEVGDNDLSAAG